MMTYLPNKSSHDDLFDNPLVNNFHDILHHDTAHEDLTDPFDYPSNKHPPDNTAHVLDDEGQGHPLQVVRLKIFSLEPLTLLIIETILPSIDS